MIHKKEQYKEKNKTSKQSDELEELKMFLTKKKVQNEALKKIISKLDSIKNNEPNK